MKRGIKYFFIIIFLMIQWRIAAQIDKKDVCTVENERIIFKLDRRWNDEERKEVAESYALDSLLMEKAFQGNQMFMYDSIQWKVENVNKNIIRLSKSLTNISTYRTNEFTISPLDKWYIDVTKSTKEFSKSYGINDFELETAFSYKDSIAQFYLPGHKIADKVYLSGTFNQWSTMKTPMQFRDSGWVVSLKLPPNRYLYKYIIDGRWSIDPNNKKKEQNEHGTYNSVVFCPTYVFRLDGYTNKRRVWLTGNFVNWEKRGLRMRPAKNGWELPVYLPEGTYFYKFVVRNEWLVDPDNPDVRKDGYGNFNSVLEIGEKHIFYLKGYTQADKVILSGSFNNWSTNELVMRKTSDGWKLPYTIAPGNYEYKYIVDGRWLIDSSNYYRNGTGDYMNSVLVIEPNYTFRLKGYQDATSVFVTGTFNNWSESGYTMKRQEGEWIFPIHLTIGKHLYKFVIDGDWINDPENPLWEENRYGTDNSVLWMKY